MKHAGDTLARRGVPLSCDQCNGVNVGSCNHSDNDDNDDADIWRSLHVSADVGAEVQLVSENGTYIGALPAAAPCNAGRAIELNGVPNGDILRDSSSPLPDGKQPRRDSDAASDGDVDGTTEYFVVAIIGCQGGGKSTLANALFDTHFPVLEARRTGRQRTTEGVWAACPRGKPVPASHGRCGAASRGTPRPVVLDIEGTDSRERGGAGRDFEARTALFTLCVSDVVLVNMWAHDIGRHQAANYDLLGVVFRESRRLQRVSEHASTANSAVGDGGATGGANAGSQCASDNDETENDDCRHRHQGRPRQRRQRVRLVVVIRDQDEDDHPMDEASRLLTDDLAEVWQRATGETAAAFRTAFELSFFALPHMLFAPAAFHSEARAMASDITRMVVVGRAGGASGNGSYESERDPVPLAGLDSVLRATWEHVDGHFRALCCRSSGGSHTSAAAAADASFNLPSFIDMAASYHCIQIYDTVRAEAAQRVYELRAQLLSSSAPMPNFATSVLDVYTRTMETYRWRARHYAATAVYERKRAELDEYLCAAHAGDAEIAQFLQQYLARAFEYYQRGFDDEFAAIIGGTADFGKRASAMQRKWQRQFEECVVREATPLADVYPDARAVAEREQQRFAGALQSSVDDRRRLGEAMLPGLGQFGENSSGDGNNGGGGRRRHGRRRTPRWKTLLLRAAALYLNYLQAKSHASAHNAEREERERDLPLGPTF